MSEPFIGEIRMVGFNYAPQNWALCNGQLIPVQQNTALFSLLGTAFGGDGVRTFGLPDLRGRVPVSFGQGPGLSVYTMGEQDGTENVTLNVTEIPNHIHTVATPCSTANATQNSPAAHYPAISNSSNGRDVTPLPTYATASTTGQTMAPVNSTSVGGSLPHTNIQPYTCVNFIIALYGVFPSRG